MSLRSNCRGHSLVELAIAVVMLVVVFGLPALLLDTSSRAFGTGSKVGEVDLVARRALDAVAGRLASSGADRVQALPGEPNASVVFQVVTGVAPLPEGNGGIEPVWGADERIELEVEPGEVVDGADNDGDGLVDEHRLVWTRDLGLASERSTVLCSRVRRSLAGEVPGNGIDDNDNGFVDEAGLLIAVEGERVLLALSVERRDAFGTSVVRTVQRSVALRN